MLSEYAPSELSDMIAAEDMSSESEVTESSEVCMDMISNVMYIFSELCRRRYVYSNAIFCSGVYMQGDVIDTT